VQLGTANRKQTTWAIVLGVIAVLAIAFEIGPIFWGGSTDPAPSATAAPTAKPTTSRPGGKNGKKVAVAENLDPTLRLDLLNATEKTLYEGSGRNIFVAQAEAVVIPPVIGKANTDGKTPEPIYKIPTPPPPAPIPLKFFGFASKPGEAKKVFLSQGEDVFVAGEGEIVDRRYKIVHISATSVEIQDVVNSGPPQTIQLTQG
jgi:hypothetical protein